MGDGNVKTRAVVRREEVRMVKRNPGEAEGVCSDNQKDEIPMAKEFHSAVWHIQEVPERTGLVMPLAMRTSYMPREGLRDGSREVLKANACLTLALPILDVFNIASAADIDIFTGLYEHITSRDDIGDGRISRILPC